VGLRGINVTLKGVPVQQINETIDYNEQFSWEWQQGIRGHGPYGGRIAREIHAGTGRGLPYPILWVADWFTLEGEYIHWARYYRIAGWYCHILLWIAFVCWGYTNILFLISPLHGSIGLTVTGIVMVLANIVYSGLWNKNANLLVIPFPDGNITLSYGWCFSLNLFTGLFCIITGLGLITFYKWPRKDKFFFEETRIVQEKEIEEEEDEEEVKKEDPLNSDEKPVDVNLSNEVELQETKKLKKRVVLSEFQERKIST